MEKAKNLIMRFKRADGKIYSIMLKNPREDLGEQEIKSTMDMIVEKGLIEPKGIKLVATANAKVITTESEILDLVI